MVLEVSSVIFGSCSSAHSSEWYDTKWVGFTIISTLIIINFTSLILIISQTSQNITLSTFPCIHRYMNKHNFPYCFLQVRFTFVLGQKHTTQRCTLYSEVRGILVQPASVCQCQSFIQSPSTETIACKNDRREFKNNGDNLQQTLYSKKLRGLFKHLQIFAKGT